MNTPSPSNQDGDFDSALSIGGLALLATLLMGALFYLGSYSMGSDFADRPPQFNKALVAGAGD